MERGEKDMPSPDTQASTIRNGHGLATSVIRGLCRTLCLAEALGSNRKPGGLSSLPSSASEYLVQLGNCMACGFVGGHRRELD